MVSIWVVHERDRAVGRKVLSHVANDTMEKLTSPSRVLRAAAYPATQHRRVRGDRRDLGTGRRDAARRLGVGASKRGESTGTSFSLSRSLSLRMVVGKRQEFLGPQPAGTSCPCPTGGVVASGGPQALILVGSILGLLSVRGVRPGPLLLSNGSQSKSISIPAARRRSPYRFLLFEKEVPRALARLTPFDFACPACIDISERPSYDLRPSISWSTFGSFIRIL